MGGNSPNLAYEIADARRDAWFAETSARQTAREHDRTISEWAEAVALLMEVELHLAAIRKELE